MIIEERAYSRAGLVGNPSDIFHGKTISLLFDGFGSWVRLYETPRLAIIPSYRDVTDFASLPELIGFRKQYGYYGGIRLIEATIVRFWQYCERYGVGLHKANFTIEYGSSIPFGIGLGGSSAIAKCVLSALMRFYELDERHLPKEIQPNLILEAETEELDIRAGPQDRVVMVYGGLVYMDFSVEAYARHGDLYGDYEKLDPGLLPPLYIAYRETLSKSSGAVHNIIRYKAEVEKDAKIREAMREKARLADEARTALLAGRTEALPSIMHRDFELRRSVYTISADNLRMIEIAREHGTEAHMTGSGGAVIGPYADERHYAELEASYWKERYSTLRVKVVEYPTTQVSAEAAVS